MCKITLENGPTGKCVAAWRTVHGSLALKRISQMFKLWHVSGSLFGVYPEEVVYWAQVDKWWTTHCEGLVNQETKPFNWSGLWALCFALGGLALGAVLMVYYLMLWVGIGLFAGVIISIFHKRF